MKTALQFYYTSCRTGQSGSAGFQFHSVSEGASAEELREIEQICGYSVSLDLDRDASPETIRTDFPILFRFRRLESGRWAIVRSTYVGRDYSGRAGNFFAHTLLVEAGRPPMWPVDYYEWPGWRSALPEGSSPSSLPAVDLADVAPASSFTASELRAFLLEDPGRPEVLARMLRALFAREETSRSVVIRDGFLDGLFWVACLQKALPLAQAPEASFSSYQFELRNCEAISVSVGDTKFNFDERERSFQFFCFDLENDSESEVPDDGGEYADQAVEWMTESPETLKRFHAFARSCSYDGLGEELVDALSLFRLMEGGRERLSLERTRRVVRFAADHAKPEALEEVAGSLVRRLDVLRAEGTAADHALLLRFLVESAAAPGTAGLEDLAISAWLEMFDRTAGGTADDRGQTEASRRHLVDRLRCEPRLAEAFLAEAHLSQLASVLAELGQDALDALAEETLRSTEARSGAPWWEPPTGPFLASLVARTGEPEVLIGRLLHPAAGSPAALTAAAVGLAKWLPRAASEESSRSRLQTLGELLAGELAGLSPSDAMTVRSALDQGHATYVIFGEFRRRLEQAEDKERFFLEWSQAVVAGLPTFERKSRGTLLQCLARAVGRERESELALQWIRSGEIDLLEDKFAARCLQLANARLPLVSADSKVDLEKLAAAAKKRKLGLKPDKPLLRRLLASGGKIKKLPEQAGGRLPEHLGALPEEDYRHFVAALAPRMVTNAATAGEHERGMAALYAPRHAAVFRRVYEEVLTQKATLAKLALAVSCWLAFGESFSGKVGLASETPEVSKMLRKLLRSKGSSERKWIRDRVEVEGGDALAAGLDKLLKPKWRLFGGGEPRAE